MGPSLFTEDRYLCQDINGVLHLLGASMEHFLKGITPLMHWRFTCMYLGALIYVELAFHWYKCSCSGWFGIFMADHSLFPKLSLLETNLKTEGITCLRSISWTSFLDGHISFKKISLSWESFPMGSLSKSISIRPVY